MAAMNAPTLERILQIDDDEDILMIAKMSLEGYGGFHVRTAASAAEGLRAVSEFRPQLVVLDYMMPGMNGDVVAQRMKRLKPSVPILLLSAYVDLPQQTLALVDRYIVKGEGPVVMLQVIAQLLEVAVHSKATSVT